MKAIRVLMAAIMLLNLFTAGCMRDVMRKEEMYLVPVPAPNVKQVMVITLPLHPELDDSEGGEGRIAWPAMIIFKDGRAPRKLHAVAPIKDPLVDMSCTRPLFITVPIDDPHEFDGALVVVCNRTKTNAYGRGTVVRLKKPDKYSFDELEKAMPKFTAGQDFAKVMRTDSAEFGQLLKIYEIAAIKRVEWMRQYIDKEYRLKLNPASQLTDEQLEEIMWKDSKVYNFAQWIGSDWKILITMPFIGFRESAFIVAAMKFITVPEIFLDEKVNFPGYDEYKPMMRDISRANSHRRRYDVCIDQLRQLRYDACLDQLGRDRHGECRSQLWYIPPFFLAD